MCQTSESGIVEIQMARQSMVLSQRNAEQAVFETGQLREAL